MCAVGGRAQPIPHNNGEPPRRRVTATLDYAPSNVRAGGSVSGAADPVIRAARRVANKNFSTLGIVYSRKAVVPWTYSVLTTVSGLTIQPSPLTSQQILVARRRLGHDRTDPISNAIGIIIHHNLTLERARTLGRAVHASRASCAAASRARTLTSTPGTERLGLGSAREVLAALARYRCCSGAIVCRCYQRHETLHWWRVLEATAAGASAGAICEA